MIPDSITIELLPEVSAWVSRLSPSFLREVAERGATFLLPATERPLDEDLRDYVESYVEYSALAANVSSLSKQQRELELQEQELEAQAEVLAAGQVRGWGVKERKRASKGEEPGGAPPAATPVPLLVPTLIRLTEEGSRPTSARDAGTVDELARQKGWEHGVALRNALTCAFALERAAGLPREQVVKETARLDRQSAVLRYRTWVLMQDNRIIQMHLGGLRARVARLSTLAERPQDQTR